MHSFWCSWSPCSLNRPARPHLGRRPLLGPYRPGPGRSPRAGCSRNPPLHHEGPSATFMPIVSTTGPCIRVALAPSSSPPPRWPYHPVRGANLPDPRIRAVPGSGHPTTPPLPHRTSTTTPTPYRHFVFDNYLAEPAACPAWICFSLSVLSLRNPEISFRFLRSVVHSSSSRSRFWSPCWPNSLLNSSYIGCEKMFRMAPSAAGESMHL
jgi:hypothetical protein